ncbi:UDP-N-acetylmuramoyl-tripeptide--D-alanyl-D-alanine ligase [Vaginisenegalia massiliensis]|uniref:UDP-N-acetylmuramoyl-tripeptide--D-alanyl-D- alanine ligase n=1 Tax=Vaginisenegalia massiliensis TaxID=2058294 RepID=UPI000F54B18D|nr:UDP-N-acetylmuramoyl-tripeptide--D-alanyl-D-alanine ligase [Vaginisenegalia massiliensis]
MKAIKFMDIVKEVKAIDYTAKDRFIEVTSVEFDSRKVTPGSLFVPLVGGATDGHDYVQKAIENGAVATFWSRSADQAPSDQIAVIFVDDTLKAMQDLAAYYRRLHNPIVVGITGSNGKTTTKDMTAACLAAKYHVHKTQGNYNNEIGGPYTILQMPADTEVLVCEMGMSEFKEIELLSQIAQPDIAAITLIGESHLEFLGSRAGIAQAKLEILAGLKEDGVFIYPGNEPLIQSQMPELTKSIQMRSFGFDSSFDAYAYDLVEEQAGTYFKTNLDPNVRCMIPVIGSYNVSNALIALSIAKELQVPLEQAIFQLAQFQLTKNRLEWLKTLNGANLLNDAYNASPTSMMAVLKTLATAKMEATGRKIAVLGDIRELGDQTEYFHRHLSQGLDPQVIDKVYLFGPYMAYLADEIKDKYAKDQIFYEESQHDRLVAALEADIQEDDIVLVKSSFGTDLLQVVTALTGKKVKD